MFSAGTQHALTSSAHSVALRAGLRNGKGVRADIHRPVRELLQQSQLEMLVTHTRVEAGG